MRVPVRQFVQEKGLKPGRYAFFFVTGEGKDLPTGEAGEALEETSGFVIDSAGRVFAFAVGWDTEQHRVGLTEWESVEPEDHWLQSKEYQRARAAVGLPAADVPNDK